MGSTLSKSKLSREALHEYAELTYFTEGEVSKLYSRFSALKGKDEEPHELDLDFRVDMETLKKLPELSNNPFLHRMYSVFASDKDGMNFDDFLDMLNAFSDKSLFPLKSTYAFKMFDFDHDGDIDETDIACMLQIIIGNQDGLGDDKLTKEVVENILHEADLDEDGLLSVAEFKNLLAKEPQFMETFKIRMKMNKKV